MNNRLRVGFSLTTIVGLLWTAVGLFDSLTQLGVGLVVACLGVIGYGAVDYVEARQVQRWQTGRDQVWERRERRHLKVVQK